MQFATYKILQVPPHIRTAIRAQVELGRGDPVTDLAIEPPNQVVF